MSLFSGLYFVYKDKGNSNRAVISLTIRIGLSLFVFGLLMASYYFGWIPAGKLVIAPFRQKSRTEVRLFSGRRSRGG